jgi:hypothetical protein
LCDPAKQFGMKISALEMEVMAFKGQVPIISKIVMDNTILEHIHIFRI